MTTDDVPYDLHEVPFEIWIQLGYLATATAVTPAECLAHLIGSAFAATYGDLPPGRIGDRAQELNLEARKRQAREFLAAHDAL